MACLASSARDPSYWSAAKIPDLDPGPRCYKSHRVRPAARSTRDVARPLRATTRDCFAVHQRTWPPTDNGGCITRNPLTSQSLLQESSFSESVNKYIRIYLNALPRSPASSRANQFPKCLNVLAVRTMLIWAISLSRLAARWRSNRPHFFCQDTGLTCCFAFSKPPIFCLFRGQTHPVWTPFVPENPLKT